MRKNLFAIRHGEATHNVLFKKEGMKTFFDHNYYDTELTNKGFNQSIELGNNWDDKNKMDLVIVSPLYRTLQTANNIFKNVKVKIIALDCLKEYPQGLHTCNKRKTKKELEKIFPTIDFNYLDSNEDLMWSDTDSETIDELLRRINKMYDFIEKTDFKNIALVGHNSFISMIKDQKLNRNEDGLDELKHCFPYKINLNFN
tara:strand:+ start:1166 stop:1765 length:600 start_codon:yes stop_codon:yes gene_type:complete